MVDILLDVMRAIIVCIILGYLTAQGRKEAIHLQPGWRWILHGWFLITFASGPAL